MVTIKDVAKKSGVSTSTVSRVLRNEGYSSEETKKIVQNVVKELGYVVDKNAQSLRSDNSKVIGIIISDVNNFFYNIILEQLTKEFKKNNYNVIITYSFEDPFLEKESFYSLLESKVEAIIFIPTGDENNEVIELAKKRGVYLLQLFREPFSSISSLIVDDSYGAYLATNHLLNKGCKNIILLSVDLVYTPNRSIGFEKAIIEKGLKFTDDLIFKFKPNENIAESLKSIIKLNKVDGIVAGTNTFGIRAIEVLMDQSKFKNGIELVVFDDIEWLNVLGVSTIAQPIEEIYSLISSHVLKSIKKDEIKKTHYKVTPILINRD